MKTPNPLLQSTIHSIRPWLALPALALALIGSPSNLGATDFYSFQDGSWFDAPNTWGQLFSPGTGDNVVISHHVLFDSSSVAQSVTVGNLRLNYGWLDASGPAILTMGGSDSVFQGTNRIDGVVRNQGTVYQSDVALVVVFYDTQFENLAGATYNLYGDGNVAGGPGGPGQFDNYGLVRKSAGTGTSSLNGFVSHGGTVEVDSGTLALSGSIAGSNGTFNVMGGAVADLTGGGISAWSGQMTGSGAGQVQLNSGTLVGNPGLVLNFPAGFFQWTGGTLEGYLTNTATVTISTPNSRYFTSGGLGTFFYNQGLVQHTNDGALSLTGGSSAQFYNRASGTYEFVGDGSISGNGTFFNAGIVRKSSGTSSVISAPFDNQGGTIEVDSGLLTLSGGGISLNGVFTVAAGAAVDLTGGASPYWSGQITGSGAGQVQLNSGTLRGDSGLLLNFPARLFQWTGGVLEGHLTNTATVTISTPNSHYFTSGGPGTFFYNQGLVRHTNDGALSLTGGSSAQFYNRASGTYEFAGDGGINSDGAFYNAGTVRKSSGTSSVISAAFNNQGGTIEVDSGLLTLSGGGTSLNGVFTVAAGAAVDLTGGSMPNWSGQITGSGAGQVQLNSGTLRGDSGLVLNFPAGLFQWTGGTLEGYLTNTATVAISSGNGHYFTSGGPGTFFYNQGLVRHTNDGALSLNGGGYAQFYNQASGTYEFAGDGNINANGTFFNAGTVRKSSGISSVISAPFNNQGGTIEVDSGQLSVGSQSYFQGGGNLTFTLGGPGTNQCGQFVCGSATLGGPLNVTLANGFAPAPGNQFQVLSCSSLSGAFTSINVPTGLSVTYSNNGVFLVATGTAPVQIVNPTLSGRNFTFSFGTVSNQSYTVQRNDDLGTTNWVLYTNFTGNGSLMQVVAPVTNAAHRFFRVREP
jgi:uncharacterized protein (DUF2164 family)